MESAMTMKQKPRRSRPPDPNMVTVRFREDQLKALRRISGPAPGSIPATIREAVDFGLLKLARARTVRC